MIPDTNVGGNVATISEASDDQKTTIFHPVSIAMDRLGLNMTLTSYKDQIEFGLIGCRRTLPSLQRQRMLDYLEDGLVELEQGAVS